GTGGDTNGTTDIYVRDRFVNVTKRASVPYNRGQAPGGSSNNSDRLAIPGDGQTVAVDNPDPNLRATGSDPTGRRDPLDRAGGGRRVDQHRAGRRQSPGLRTAGRVPDARVDAGQREPEPARHRRHRPGAPDLGHERPERQPDDHSAGGRGLRLRPEPDRVPHARVWTG